MGRSRGKSRITLNINSNLPTEEEIEISHGVAERRNELRVFATSNKRKFGEKRGYQDAIADSIRNICKELQLVGTTSRNDHIEFPLACQASISRDPRSPLFDKPGPIYKSISIVEWLGSFHELCQQCLGETKFRLDYRQQDCKWMADKCVLVLEMICNEMQGVKVYENYHKVVDGKSQALSDEEVARIRTHLSAAVDEWYGLGVDPTNIAEELVAVILYTTELKTENVESIIHNPEIHGKNPSFCGVMNWSMRVFRDSEMNRDAQEMNSLESTIQLFLPIIARIDVFLSRSPKVRTTLFGGVPVRIPANKYQAGSLIPWTVLSSKTADFRTSYELGCMLLIAHVHNASAIDYATLHPEKAEHLMPTYTWVKAVSRMSPTVLRILGSMCNYITVQSAGDEPTIDQLIERLVRNEESHFIIFEKFMSCYVEHKVHREMHEFHQTVKTQLLFSTTHKLLEGNSKQHLLLLGSSGSGKSSALLALYYNLSRESRNKDARHVIPIFIPLASMALGENVSTALVRALLYYLGVSPSELREISSRCKLVVLLDSLDECGDRVKSWLDPFAAINNCCVARVIVSCNTEYFDGKVHPLFKPGTHTKRQAYDILYVQPFRPHQLNLFLEKRSADMKSPVTVNDLISLGIPEALLYLPMALTMAVEVLQRQREFGDSMNSVPFLDFACPEKTRVEWYSAYLNSYCLRKKREFADSQAFEVVDVIDAENTARLRKALQDVAITMLAQGTWTLPLSEVRTIFENYFGNSRDVVDNAMQHSPMRLESLDDPDAEFSFWHKSIGAFLCAAALCGNESKAYLEMTGKGRSNAFSKRELEVLMFFRELATPIGRFKKVYNETLLGALLESRDLRKPAAVARKDFVDSTVIRASNAMALLAISQYPLQGFDLRNLVIKNCLAYDGCFRGTMLNGTYFEDCNLSRSDFEGASVQGTDFVRCTFASLKRFGVNRSFDSAYSVCWSPDGKLVASGSSGKSVRVWEVESGREVKQLEGHTSPVNSVCWSPDGKLVASGSWDKSIRVWAVASGQGVKKLEGHTNWVLGVCWSPGGKLVASGSDDNSIRVWAVASGQGVKKLEGHTDWVRSVCWSPDGKLVASASADRSIRVWEVESGSEVKRLQGHTDSVLGVCWSPDGKLIASGSADRSIRVWEVASGREVKKLEGHTNDVNSVCWSPDGELIASGSADRSIRVWEVESGRGVKKLEGHIDSVLGVCWSPDGKLVASGSDDCTVRVWQRFVRQGEILVQSGLFSDPIPYVILGRQPVRMPPFRVHGELGLHSLSNRFVSEQVFKTPDIKKEERCLFKLTP